MEKIKFIIILVLLYACTDQIIAQIPEMIDVPSGFFVMGADSLGFAEHEVALTHDFEISKYEITVSEFGIMLNFALNENELFIISEESVLNLNGDQQEILDLDSNHCQIEYVGNVFHILETTEQLPIVEVTWYGAAFYCNMLSRMNGENELYDLENWNCNPYLENGFRLPTEAEWEYSARYNDGRIYPWGNEPPDSNRVNCLGLGIGGLAEVGSYSPLGDSSLGFCEMSGNVWEWCNDWFGDYSSEPQIDPIGSETGIRKVIRGAGWFSPIEQLPAANRSRNYQDHSYYDFGFRVAYLPEQTSIEPELENELKSFIYPNPWKNNISSEIRFSLLNDVISKVEIFSIRGQKIRSIESSTGLIIWDGKDSKGKIISSGIYLCRIYAASKRIIQRKLLILK